MGGRTYINRREDKVRRQRKWDIICLMFGRQWLRHLAESAERSIRTVSSFLPRRRARMPGPRINLLPDCTELRTAVPEDNSEFDAL